MAYERMKHRLHAVGPLDQRVPSNSTSGGMEEG